jgi:hypothetical protein
VAIETINNCSIINLRKIENSKGNLSPVENGIDIPFDVQRVYYLYDVPGGETRGGHAHKDLQQLIIAVAGSFDVILDDGFERKIVKMNRSNYGLYVPRMIWREIVNFSTGSICLVLASLPYSDEEYIREFGEFLHIKKCSVNKAS